MRISVGRYLPGDSIVHSMDPRQKVISTLIVVSSVILCEDVFEYVFPFSMLLYHMISSRIGLWMYLKGVKNLWMLVTFAVVVQYLSFGPVPALYIALRLILILIAGEILSYTTQPTSLTYAMEDIMRWAGFSRKTAQEFSLVMGIALRFSPIFLDEAERIAKAQISRGAPIDSGPILERLKATVSIVVPLMYSSMRKAEELALAMEARGFVPGKERTRFREFEWRKVDTLALLLSSISLILVILTP